MSLKRYQIWLLAGAIALCVFAGERLYQNHYSAERVLLPPMQYIHAGRPGSFNVVAVDREGGLWIWGNNDSGQIGTDLGNERDQFREPVRIMTDVVKAKAASNFCAALKTDGSLWTWGVNTVGQCGNGTISATSEPQKILNDVMDFDIAQHGGMAVKDDSTLWQWGYFMLGEEESELGINVFPEPRKRDENVLFVAQGSSSLRVITSDYDLYAAGVNDKGQLGVGDLEDHFDLQFVKAGIRYVKSGDYHTAAIDLDDNLWMWGKSRSGSIGLGDRYAFLTIKEPLLVLQDVAMVDVEHSQSIAVKNDGSLWIWGDNIIYEDGQKPEKPYYAEPVKVEDNVIDAAIGFGLEMAFYIKEDGSLWSWGSWYWLSGRTEDKETHWPTQITHGYILR